MLKIKDNVDLKELEKFGFNFNKYIRRYINNKYSIYGYDNCLLINDDRVIVLNDPHSDITFDEGNFDVLFDLIEAGLVEKVEEEVL